MGMTLKSSFHILSTSSWLMRNLRLTSLIIISKDLWPRNFEIWFTHTKYIPYLGNFLHSEGRWWISFYCASCGAVVPGIWLDIGIRTYYARPICKGVSSLYLLHNYRSAATSPLMNVIWPWKSVSCRLFEKTISEQYNSHTQYWSNHVHCNGDTK